MGTNTIGTQVDGTVIEADDINDFKTAITTDFVPRNSSGEPATGAGDIGSSTYEWNDLYLAGRIIQSGTADRRNSATPSGSMSFYAGSTAPTGWILCKGETIGNATSGATHAAADLEDLFNIVKAAYGNAGTEVFADGDTVSLPDPRGYFMRVLDQGKGVDSGRAIGTTQSDQNKQHNHTGVVPSFGRTASADADSGSYRWGVTNSDTSLTINNSGGTEARVKNFAVPMIIKI